MKHHLHIIIILISFCATAVNAQKPDSIIRKENSAVTDPKIVTATPVTIVALDTTRRKDSTAVKVSKDGLDAPVDYGAKDSILFDNKNNLVHLYGNAFVNYGNLKLTASYIVVDMKNSIATAEPRPDSSGKMAGLPNFKDGTQDVSANKMRYNFVSRKGVILEARSKQNDMFIHGGKSKFVASNGDSTQQVDNTIYSKDAIFTTCSADHPHFGIVSSKQKVIPNKLIVVGPSNLVIGDIPTPLWLPFAAFPLKQGKRTGLIFPRDYEYSPTWGFGLKNMGWYFPLSDNYDLTLQGDLYVRGTWGLRASSRYVKKYRYQGNFEVGYASTIKENELSVLSRDPSWNIRWSHSKDSRVNPTISFNASVNMSGSKSNDPTRSNYNSVVRNDFNSATTSQLQSSISFTKMFPGKPYSLSGSFQHSQNTVTRDVTMSLPNLDFTMQTIFPFKQKNRVGPERFYEKIALQYSSSLQNQILTKDSLLLTQRAFDNLKFGVRHNVSSNVNFNILKYFNFSPSVNYTEYWYINQINKTFDPTQTFKIDTVLNPNNKTDTSFVKRVVQDGLTKSDTIGGFYRPHQFNLGASLTTRIFGTVQFKNGWLRGIRHSISPSVSFNYSPSYYRYTDSVRTTNSSLLKQVYSRYENSIYGAPNGGKQMAIGYNLTNLFELKTFNSKDSTFKKRKLLENVNISGNYNFAADSFRFSDISMSTGTNLFKGLSTLSVGALFSPYGRLSNNLRSREYAYKENGRFLTFLNTTVSLNTGISIGDIYDLVTGKSKDEPSSGNTRTPSASKKSTKNANDETFIDLFKQFRLNHVFSISVDRNFGGRDTTLFQNSLYTSGNIKLSKKWTMTVGNIGYDFVQKQLTYPDISFSRDLHCWDMGMSWQPVRGTYNFFLRVKPGTLDFIKVPYQQNISDGQYRRF
ncbi:MAG: LPS-assembly protein LptD [Saprospiraceae bacterium]|nr:LPS-assembly protein LptD [Saprospiraceae bacterium]